MPIVLKESQVLDFLMPLQFFCGEQCLPSVEFLEGNELPEPERSLLVHDRDMTPTLREHHSSSIDLRVHRTEGDQNYVMRAVVLLTREKARPVEFGAIGIRLEDFPPAAAEDVLGGMIPLGAILEKHAIPHSSHPRAFFRIVIDEALGQVLDAEPGAAHYGRCNELRDSEGMVFADIVEILPRG